MLKGSEDDCSDRLTWKRRIYNVTTSSTGSDVPGKFTGPHPYRHRQAIASIVALSRHHVAGDLSSDSGQSRKEVGVGKVFRSVTTPSTCDPTAGHAMRLLTPRRLSVPPSTRPPAHQDGKTIARPVTPCSHTRSGSGP